MSDEATSIEKLQALITRGPFNRWLNFTVLKAGDLVWFRSGTEHCSYSPNGCLLAVHIAAMETVVE